MNLKITEYAGSPSAAGLANMYYISILPALADPAAVGDLVSEADPVIFF